jgi:subtilase family serine protease
MSLPLRRALVAAAATGAVALVVTTVPAGAAPAQASPNKVTLDAAPDWTHTATAAGPTDAKRTVRLSAVLPMRDAAAAESLALAVNTPGNAQYGHFLTAAQFRSRFAPTDATVATVSSWLKGHGFAVTNVPANHRFVSFTGTVDAANAAFGVALTDYMKDGKRTSAPSRSVTVPAELAGSIAGISGLDASAITQPSHLTAGDDTAARPASTKAGTAAAPDDALPGPAPAFVNAPPCSDFYGQKPARGLPDPLPTPLSFAPCGYKPGQIRSAYGLAGANAARLDGRGQTVAIVDAYASPTIRQDATRYAQLNDPRHPLRGNQFTQITAPDFSLIEECDAQGWYGEETLDVEAVHATAPGANILYVGAASCDNPDILDAVNAVVDGGLASIISNSYGNAGEQDLGDISGEHQTYVQAAAQGITVLFSSGDAGDDIQATGLRQPDYPASDDFVTAVGGTSLAIGRRGQTLFETGWGTKKAVLTNGKFDLGTATFNGGGGGGTSRLFPQPAYQRRVVPASIANVNNTGTPGRAVPDVAALGDPNTGFLIGQTQEFPDGTIKYSQFRIGGTSLSSPLMGGVQAVANQVAHRQLGFINPALYRLNGSVAFHDIRTPGVRAGVVRVDFANLVDASDGTITSLRTLNDTGTISVRRGYDDVTGNGTPNGAAYLVGLALVH